MEIQIKEPEEREVWLISTPYISPTPLDEVNFKQTYSIPFLIQFDQ